MDHLANGLANALAACHQSDAGVPEALKKSWAYQEHAFDMRGCLAMMMERQWGPMTHWGKDYLSHERSSDLPCIYPFSGPDVATPLSLFGPRDITLLGLEAVRPVDLTLALHDTKTFEHLATSVRKATKQVFSGRWSFYPQADMRVQLCGTPGVGILPILLAMLGGLGVPVLALEVANIAIKITYEALGKPHVLRYFMGDINQPGLIHPGFDIQCKRPHLTLCKATSYVPFEPKGKAFMQQLLSTSQTVVTDESGPPLEIMPGSIWDTNAFGSYQGPDDKYPHNNQPSLAKLVDNKALGFKVGYAAQSNCLIVARRKGAWPTHVPTTDNPEPKHDTKPETPAAISVAKTMPPPPLIEEEATRSPSAFPPATERTPSSMNLAVRAESPRKGKSPTKKAPKKSVA